MRACFKPGIACRRNIGLGKLVRSLGLLEGVYIDDHLLAAVAKRPVVHKAGGPDHDIINKSGAALLLQTASLEATLLRTALPLQAALLHAALPPRVAADAVPILAALATPALRPTFFAPLPRRGSDALASGDEAEVRSALEASQAGFEGCLALLYRPLYHL